MAKASPQPIPDAARLFIGAIGLLGLLGMFFTFHGWTPEPSIRFLTYLLIALVGAVTGVSFPGLKGNLSVSYVCAMLGLLELKLPEALALTMAMAIVQTFWDAKVQAGHVKLPRLFFNTTCLSLALLAAARIYYQPWFEHVPEGELLRLMLASAAYFAVNMGSLSIVIALTENRSIATIWKEFCNWSFCYYLVGALLAELVHRATHRLGWAFILALLPVFYVIYRSYRLYVTKLEQEKAFVENTAALHLRTIEALATAIEAKDECTHEHLRRVQVYSLEVAKQFGLSPEELQALQAASILHDIGKLAVPDFIISKPGKLTPEEFEKMKVHTVVGAEILEQVEFPYPVSPIVRSHHEKWDGSGYPDGLKGEQIPIGARILSAVDCLDALASDRQYRRALPLDEAMDYVASFSGRHFDPQVVDVLKANYREFEQLAQNTPLRGGRLSRDLVVRRGEAPDAGFEKSMGTAVESTNEAARASAGTLVAARREIQPLLELNQHLHGSLGTGEVFSVLAERLKQLVPFDAMVVYIREGVVLRPRYVSGENSRVFASLEIPVGQGLSGWVVENWRPIINGNPSVEPGYLNDPNKLSALQSALSIPLGDATDQISGALTFYRAEKDAYSTDHLRVLTAIKGEITRTVEAAIKLQPVQLQATADELTGLPNERSLRVCLENELRRCESESKTLTVMLCDLDGFEDLNHRFGQSAGNQMLKRVARILRSNCRTSDYVARTGADEFVVLMASTHAEELAQRTEVLDRMIRKAGLEICNEETPGISVGVACFPDDAKDPDSLLSYASQDMHRARRARMAGRGKLLQPAHSLERPA